VLYVLSECINTTGFLTAFSIDVATGALREIGRLSMTGKSTCYISFDRDAHHAVITNYWDGIINVVKLDERSGAPLAVVQEHQQTRRDTWRQVEDRPVRGLAGGGDGGRGGGTDSWHLSLTRLDECAAAGP
jgi:6-phosphogluconolactonase (cycloisomerase 2 family)